MHASKVWPFCNLYLCTRLSSLAFAVRKAATKAGQSAGDGVGESAGESAGDGAGESVGELADAGAGKSAGAGGESAGGYLDAAVESHTWVGHGLFASGPDRNAATEAVFALAYGLVS